MGVPVGHIVARDATLRAPQDGLIEFDRSAEYTGVGQMQTLDLEDKFFDPLDNGELNHMILLGWIDIKRAPLVFTAKINRDKQRLVLVQVVQHTLVDALEASEVERFRGRLGGETKVTVVYFK